jgi:hypothetical protein
MAAGAQVSAKKVACICDLAGDHFFESQPGCEVDFMVKLLRACVWMPWRKQAMKDVTSCDKLRVAANRL